MNSKPSKAAYDALDSIVTDSSSKEIVDAIRAAFYSKAMDKLDDARKDAASRIFDKAVAAQDMEHVEAKLPKETEDKRAKEVKDTLQKTGEHGRGGIEYATQYKGEPDVGMGWMQPLGKPMKPWGGDRRQGFIPPGGGV